MVLPHKAKEGLQGHLHWRRYLKVNFAWHKNGGLVPDSRFFHSRAKIEIQV
jgi:hypothetical protein